MLCLIIITLFSEYRLSSLCSMMIQLPRHSDDAPHLRVTNLQTTPHSFPAARTRGATLHNPTDNRPVPPLGVFLISGCGVDFWINVLLTILG